MTTLLERARGWFMHDRLTIEEACHFYIDVHTGESSPSTLRMYDNAKKHLVRYFGDHMPVKELTYEHAERFRGNLFTYRRYSTSRHSHYRFDGKGLARATIRQILKCARAMFAFLVKIEKTDFNPFDRIKLPKLEKKKIREVTLEDMRKLLKCASLPMRYRKHDDLTVARDTAVISSLISTGCRVGGVASMQMSNLEIGQDRGTIVVREKGVDEGRFRNVFLSESATIAMMLWLDVRPKTYGHDYIFVGLNKGLKDPQPLIEGGIYQILKRLKKRWNDDLCVALGETPIKSPVNPHAFRHAFIKNLIREGKPESAIADLAGNTVKVMREEYGLLGTNDLQEIHSDAKFLDIGLD